MFDPYRKWLGIPLKDQPPNHYRLFGLELFESDLDVIEGAAERQMGFVRQYQSGEHAADAARILNELAKARLCLLKPASKTAYDEKLRAELTPAEPEPSLDFSDLPMSDADLNLDSNRRKIKKTKSGKSKPSSPPPQLMIAGGAGAVVCVLLLVFLLSGRGQKPVEKPQEPNSIAVNTPTKTPTEKEATDSTASTNDPASSILWPDTKLGTEPAGPPVDLVKLVDLDRDVALGKWEKTSTALISERKSRLHLPTPLPEDYQLKFAVRRIEGADTLGIGFMMGGRQGVVVIDGWNATASGLYVDGREANDNSTTRRGKLFEGASTATIVLTVHPGHFHATFDGKTIIDWFGNSERMYLHSGHLPIGSRQTPFLAAFDAKYVFESASLVPLKPEPAPPRVARLDREVDVLPLMDVDRDVVQGVWGVNKGTLYSPEGWGRIYVPTVVPEEYTVSATVELPPENQGFSAFVFGLIAGKSASQFVCTRDGTGLDMIDGRRWDNNETRLAGQLLKSGIPVRIACTVTKSGIRVEADGRTLIDWRGDVRRLSLPGDWALPDARRLYLGSISHFKLRDVKLGPPLPAPKTPEHPPFSIGKPVDLLALIDPERDAVEGTWEREGASLRCLGDVQHNKLALPIGLPDEYKLTMRVARMDGGKSNNECLYFGLPTGQSRVDVLIDGAGSTISGADLDYRDYGASSITRRGAPVIAGGGLHEIVALVRKTGLQVTCDGNPVLDWTGNPERFSSAAAWVTPGRHLALGSYHQRFRFEKLELEPLPPTSFPPVEPLGADGKLLPIINADRDARLGDWKLEGDALTCRTRGAARLKIPAPVPKNYVLSGTVERIEGGRQLNVGLLVDGHPCAIVIDADGMQNAGIDLLDGKRYFDGLNLVYRNYKGALLPQNQRVPVRCLVLPDTIVVTCGDKEVIRWHGDPRRLTILNEMIPPNYSEADRTHLFLGSWESGFAFRDLELKPLSDAEADQLSKSFSGVFPTTPQKDVPFATAAARVETTDTKPAPQSSTPIKTPSVAAPTKISNLLSVPKRSDVDAARSKISKAYAAEYKEAKNPAKLAVLVGKLLERAADAREPALERFAHFMEARDLHMQTGDLLAAFRVVDAMAVVFDIPRFDEEADLIQQLSKKAKNAVLNRYLAIVAWKLAGDAAAEEDYTAAKTACQRAVSASRGAGDSDLQTRATTQLRYYESLFTEWKGAKDGEQRLVTQPDDDLAHAAIGEYRCWVRRDWTNGLPSLRRSKDAKLVQVVTADLANPNMPAEQRALAVTWLAYAKASKSLVIRGSAGERASYWLEQAVPSLRGSEKTDAEKELESAYELACGRDFKRVLSQPASGVELPATVNCSTDDRPLTLKPSFDIKKSWLLSFEFKQPNLDGGWHQIFFWGDGAGGDDPLWVRTEGNRLAAVIENVVEDRGQSIDYTLPGSVVGQWTDLKFLFDATGGNLELYINHRLIRRDSLAIMPAVDRNMPLMLGSAGGNSQRWGGQVRNFWLGNIP